MSSKYKDKHGTRISASQYSKLIAEGDAYSKVKQIEFESIRVSINWIGKFDSDIPDEYCRFLRILIENKVNNKWVVEPIVSALSDCENIAEACKRFDAMTNIIKENNDPVEERTQLSESDLEDFGEPEVSKNIPRTKSSKMGMW